MVALALSLSLGQPLAFSLFPYAPFFKRGPFYALPLSFTCGLSEPPNCQIFYGPRERGLRSSFYFPPMGPTNRRILSVFNSRVSQVFLDRVYAFFSWWRVSGIPRRSLLPCFCPRNALPFASSAAGACQSSFLAVKLGVCTLYRHTYLVKPLWAPCSCPCFPYREFSTQLTPFIFFFFFWSPFPWPNFPYNLAVLASRFPIEAHDPLTFDFVSLFFSTFVPPSSVWLAFSPSLFLR